MDWEFAYNMASYYLWRAKKDPTLPGNNPITGINRDKGFYPIKYHHINEAKIAYMAMTRYWLGVARDIRLS